MSHHTPSSTTSSPASTETTRRDFLVLTASALTAVGGAAAIWPFINSMNPSADVLALASTEVDISAVPAGQIITVMWRGKPVFIRHRTPEEIKTAQETPLSELKDPQKDEDRVQKGHEQWLVTLGVCTHLGCVPVNFGGEYKGWLCPCHGSQFDTSGRIRKGPAPTNLPVPEYSFLTPTTIKIG